MKRLIPILLALVLLCGCALEPQPETEVTETQLPTTEYVEPTEPAGSYVPASQTELATGGALRVYNVEQKYPYAIAVSEDDVLLLSGLDRTTLTLMTGENLYTVAQTTIDMMVHPDDPSFQISEKGITYFDNRDGSIVFLDQDLKEVSRKQTPETMVGSPILSENRMKLYYCTPDSIRLLDLETGIDRLLKEMSYPEQWLEGILLNDTVLYCGIRDGEKEEALFLSAQTGELLCQRENDLCIAAGKTDYLAQIPDGILTLPLFGKEGGEAKVLNALDPFGDVMYLDAVNAALSFSGTAGDFTVDYYDLDSGIRSASVRLTDVFIPHCVDTNGKKGDVYLFAENYDSDGYTLYRWDPAKSVTDDETVYTGIRYTLENPDVNGLALCSDRAYGMSQTYGVEIRVGMDAVANEPWDYELYPEHQVSVINQMLDRLELVLQQFPDGFFTTLSEKTTKSPVKICLVRNMYGSPKSGSLETASGIQFWTEEDAYVVLAAGEYFAQTFYHEMFHILETCVYGHSNAYDDWNKLNPKGFEYDYDYLKNLDRAEGDYLKPGSRSFIDTYSMSYPKEDRARIMEYAAMPGNEDYFMSNTMQKKLKTLCVGIREAFDLREYPVVLLWEQYLEKPLVS